MAANTPAETEAVKAAARQAAQSASTDSAMATAEQRAASTSINNARATARAQLADLDAQRPAPAPQPSLGDKAGEKLRAGGTALKESYGKARDALDDTKLGKAGKALGAAGVLYEASTTIVKGRSQLAEGDARGAMETAGKGVGVIGGVAASAAAMAMLGAKAGPYGAAIGLIAGAATAVLTAEEFGNVGGKAMAALLPEQKDMTSESDRVHQNYLNALKVKVRAGSAATPAQNDAVTTARAELEKFRKENITETAEQRAASMRSTEDMFTKLAVRDAALLANAPKALEEAKAKFKAATTAFLTGGTAESQAQFQAATKTYMQAQRTNLRAQGKTQTIEETRAFTEAEFNGYAAEVEAARSAARAAAPAAAPAPAGSPAAAPAPAGSPAASAPAPSFTQAMTPPAPPPREKSWYENIPVIGPMIAGFFGAGETDPAKKSQFGKLIDTAFDWMGDKKKGLSGMGMLAVGAAVFAAVTNFFDGGIIMGLLAAAVAIPIISSVMKAFDTPPAPQGVRAPAVEGPAQAQTQQVGHQQQVSTSGPAVQAAAQKANLQPTANLMTGGATVPDGSAPAQSTPPAPAVDPAAAGRSAAPN